MIDLKDAEQRIGRWVVYQPAGGGRCEDGVITSVNDTYAFVRYTSGGSKATHPRDLEWGIRQ